MRALDIQPGLVEQVYDSILDAICDGQLLPRQRLTQEGVARDLDVSRQPVGQALGLLKAQGFVCDTGRRGLMVAPLAPDFVRHHYEYRGAVDSLAAGIAASLRTQADLDRARVILDQGRAAVADGSAAALIAADTAFHRWVYRTAGNPIVVEAMDQQWNHTRRAMSAVVEMSGDWPARIWDEHAAIIAAIEARDAERARALALAHTVKASKALIETLERIPNGEHPNGEHNV
jgi:DNA-binding GntR family transcriptional regulator